METIDLSSMSNSGHTKVPQYNIVLMDLTKAKATSFGEMYR